MNIKVLSSAIGTAIVLMCASSLDAFGSPPSHAGPPGGGGPPGLSESPGNSAFGHSQGGQPDWPDPIDPPSGFTCEYTAGGVTADWINDSDGVCGPLYGGDLEFEVDYIVKCVEGDPISPGMRVVTFNLDTDPEAVWNFTCGEAGESCNATTGAWTDIDAAIELLRAEAKAQAVE